MSRRTIRAGMLLCLGMTVAATAQVSREPAAAPAAASAGSDEKTQALAPITAILTAGDKTARVKLMGLAGDKLMYVDADLQGSPQRLLPKGSVDSVFFQIELNSAELDQAVQNRNWMTAAGVIIPVVQPAIPYLDLPNNNVLDLIVEAGDYIMRAAAVDLRAAKTPEEEQKAVKKYEAAYAILVKAAKATWSSKGMIAHVKSIKCLLELNKPKTATKSFEMLEAPFPGDAAYGIYWLVKAELEAKKSKFPEAMDATVKSLCFENKDIDTFPDALLLSARCYEEMQEWYRARDVYYEVARVFPRTDWCDIAAQRLEFILSKGLTKDEEKLPIQNVFFGKEDMNKLSREYLEARKKGTEVDLYAEFEKEDTKIEDLDKIEEDKKKDEGFDQMKGPPDEGPPTTKAPPAAPKTTPEVKPPTDLKKAPNVTRPIDRKAK